MPEPTTQQLHDVFCHVLETLAFMFGDPVDEPVAPEETESCIEVTVGYQGPSSGSLTLLATEEVAQELASNLLGVDPDDEGADELARDALGELMNVTLGQLLTTIEGDKPVFDLTPPQVQTAPAERGGEMIDSPLTVGFDVEGSTVLLQLNTDPAQAAA